MERAYYNEIDPFAAQWLRNLIDAGLIPAGDVDERSIVDVRADDLIGYDQCHFFAGIGGWPLALRLAGWPDDRPVWTGSCPCQPLSGAGLRKGHADDRHLWPAFHRLIAERAPATVFGEQVASADGREWLAAVRADLEALGHAVGAADLCAAGGGAPHIRQRLFWVADAGQVVRRRREGQFRSYVSGPTFGNQETIHDQRGRATDGLEHADRKGRDAGQPAAQADRHRGAAGSNGGAERVGDAIGARLEKQHRQPGDDGPQQPTAERTGADVGGMAGEIDVGWPSAHHGGWGDADRLFCTDGRWRPVEPGTFPLAHGVPGRVGRLRAYGNAIVPQVAAAFIRAVMDGVTATTKEAA